MVLTLDGNIEYFNALLNTNQVLKTYFYRYLY